MAIHGSRKECNEAFLIAYEKKKFQSKMSQLSYLSQIIFGTLTKAIQH